MVPRVSSSRSLTADQQHRALDSLDTGKGGRGGTLPSPLPSPTTSCCERGASMGTGSRQPGKGGDGYGSSLTRQVKEEERETLRPEQWDSGQGLLQFNNWVTLKTSAKHWCTGTISIIIGSRAETDTLTRTLP